MRRIFTGCGGRGWSAWLGISGAFALSACASGGGAPTQVIVAVDADSDVASTLTRVEIAIFDPAAAAAGGSVPPVDQRPFALNAEKQTEGSVAFPFSVGVVKNRANRFLVVVTGYEGERARIEQKALVNFVRGERRAVGIYLASTCFGRVCGGEPDSADWLSSTCNPALSGDCGEVAEAPTTEVKPGEELDASLLSGAADADVEPANDGGVRPDGEIEDPSVALGSLGQPCGEAETLACDDRASRNVLRCAQGSWREEAVCAEDQRCDSRPGAQQGTCTDVAAACAAEGRAGVVCSGTDVITCNEDLITVATTACPSDAHCEGFPPACTCDDGFAADELGVCIAVPPCSANQCQHGSRCVETGSTYACDCTDTGYSGARCESDLDECASATLCDWPEYPCEQTVAPGYVCRGQLADWHMPDRQSGAKYPPRYDATSSAGLVRDLVTGLQWQQGKPALYTGCTGTGSSAQRGETCTWSEAKAYCDQLALAEFSDFRLPSKIELESLLDMSAKPTIDPTFVTVNDAYWASSPVVLTTDGARSDLAWYVYFADGFSLAAPTVPAPGAAARAYPVRCVRGGTLPSSVPTPATRYAVDAQRNEVTDARTGLVWQWVVSSSRYAWADAGPACTQLGNGYRLPTYKELQTLIDPRRAQPAISFIFTGTPSDFFWSATPYSSAGYAWHVSFLYGDSAAAGTSEQNYIRCVR